MSEQVLAMIVIVAAVTVLVWAAALVSRAVDLGILPVRRRRRVEWCQAHDRQVRLVGSGLLAILVVYQLLVIGGALGR
jgi:hypothetical protein